MNVKFTEEGLIDFSSISFESTCIKVNENYFHNKKLKNVQELKDFFSLTRQISECGLLESLHLLADEEEDSEKGIESLMMISAIIPTFMLEKNLKRI